MLKSNIMQIYQTQNIKMCRWHVYPGTWAQKAELEGPMYSWPDTWTSCLLGLDTRLACYDFGEWDIN